MENTRAINLKRKKKEDILLKVYLSVKSKHLPVKFFLQNISSAKETKRKSKREKESRSIQKIFAIYRSLRIVKKNLNFFIFFKKKD